MKNTVLKMSLVKGKTCDECLELGMPAQPGCIHFDVSPAFIKSDDERVKLEWRARLARANDLKTGPCLYMNGVHIQLWRQRISLADSPIYGDILWRPDRGIHFFIGGLEHSMKRHSVNRVLRLLGTLKRLQQLGRPVGSGTFDDSDDFRTQVDEACSSLRLQGTSVTQETVAKLLGLELRYFKRLLVVHNVDWQEMKRRPE